MTISFHTNRIQFIYLLNTGAIYNFPQTSMDDADLYTIKKFKLVVNRLLRTRIL